jgi:hypothetical protein
MTTTTQETDWTAKSGVWTVHSEMDNHPQLRGFAKTQAEAEGLMAKIKAGDADADKTRYWVYEISKGALQDFRDFNMLPEGF